MTGAVGCCVGVTSTLEKTASIGPVPAALVSAAAISGGGSLFVAETLAPAGNAPGDGTSTTPDPTSPDG
ncbi:MAG: hypothetical protein IPJ14_21885 [Kineosporiaceae bacterium]|nr:hypothetical protein [Kineosporiaceae bacterium]